MEDWQELIDSGLLDLYVLGETNAEENLYIEKMSALHPEIQREINEIGIALEKYALNHAIQPDPIIKPFLLATIDYTTRLKAGEPVSLAPTLNEHASAKDYQQWLERPDMVLPADFEDVHARILSYTPEAITAIVWIKEMAPQEVHDQEYERFFDS